MPYIYLIRLHGDPKYIGYTNNSVQKRWTQHRSAARRNNPQVLYQAIRKHGEEAFSIEVLVEHEDAIYLRDVMEQKLIEEYQTHVSHGSGYNVTYGGEGCYGRIPSEETRKRISEAKKGSVCREETRKRISNSKKGSSPWMKGRHHSEHSRNMMSLAKRGKPSPKKGIKGKPHSQETKKRMSESHKKRLGLNTHK